METEYCAVCHTRLDMMGHEYLCNACDAETFCLEEDEAPVASDPYEHFDGADQVRSLSGQAS